MTAYKDNTALIAKSQAGDETATEELIRINYPLAVSVAARFTGRGTDTEDLIQIGLMGMLKAIRTFDLERGTAFSTYAVPLIIGEIRRFLRDDGLIKVGRRNKQNSAIVMKCREQWLSRTGTEPHIDQLSELSGLSPDEIEEALDCGRPVVSLSEPLGTDGDGLSIGSMVEDSSSSMDKVFDRIALANAMSELPETWRKIVMMRYFRDMSQQQTADALGLSQVKISREEKKIIEYLRSQIV